MAKRQRSKIESKLLVPTILSFSKNLWCLNFPVWEQCCQQKNSKNDQKFFESAKMKKYIFFFSHQKCLVTLFCACVSAKFKHLKFFENVKIIGTNNIDSILGYCWLNCRRCRKQFIQNSTFPSPSSRDFCLLQYLNTMLVSKLKIRVMEFLGI